MMKKTDMKRPRNRIHPWVALCGLSRVIRDPDDTVGGALFVAAVAGDHGERLFQRFRSDPKGAALLAQRPSLLARLQVGEALRALPEGTLGRVFVEWTSAEQISAEGLVGVVESASHVLPEMDRDRQFVSDRIRDLHDLWHVVTGYDRDLLGEYALLTFSYAQLGTPGFGLLIPLSYLFFGMQGSATRRLVRNAYRRGRNAPWLPVQDWEGMLERPLAKVRETLGLGPPPPYEQFRSRGAPAHATELLANP